MISMNPRQGPTGTRHRLLTWPIVLFLLAAVAATTSFYLLLTVVPTYAAASAGSSTAAGLATGTLMLTTVAAELASPRLIARFGRPAMLAAGLLLLGLPAMLLIAAAGPAGRARRLRAPRARLRRGRGPGQLLDGHLRPGASGVARGSASTA